MCLYNWVMSSNDADKMANSVDPDLTAPLGAVWSGSALFAQAYLSENLGLLLSIDQDNLRSTTEEPRGRLILFLDFFIPAKPLLLKQFAYTLLLFLFPSCQCM